jgi:hypothetical protein
VDSGIVNHMSLVGWFNILYDWSEEWDQNAFLVMYWLLFKPT